MDLTQPPTVQVEVVHARPGGTVRTELRVPAGATLRQVIARSGLLRRCPEIDLSRNPVGVFGVVRNLDEPVAAGDRVEIYRPLPSDPKEMRRRRAVTRFLG